MDPISIIVTACFAGAALGAKDVSKNIVVDSYEGLKGLLKKAVLRKGDTEEGKLISFFELLEENPDQFKEIFANKLKNLLPEPDEDIVKQAEELNNIIENSGYNIKDYTVNVSDSQGVQIGNNNIQNNQF